jgi:hypothetical protein
VKEHKDSTQWWDNYEDQKAVIIEDADVEFMNRNYFLRLIDKVPMQVQTKGGMRNLLVETVYISSNYPKEALFPYAPPQVLRRFHEVWETRYHSDHQLPDDASEAQAIDCATFAIFNRTK